MTTPWGQEIVPTLDTYVDLGTINSLQKGQKWADFAQEGKKLRDNWVAGKLVLSKNPWQIAKGVWSIGTNSLEQQTYLIDTGKGLLLIDPSLDKWQNEIIGHIKELGFKPIDVKWVLLTHCHIDHGQSCHFWKKMGAKTYIGEGDAHPMESCNSIVATWVEEQAEGKCIPCPIDNRIHDGDILKFGNLTIHALNTKGHTPGSTVFYFARGGKNFLISGDIALHNGRHAWMGNPYADWGQYSHSLDKIMTFSINGKPVKFDVLMPGHGTIDLTMADRSISQTKKVVEYIIAQRSKGEKLDWVEVYPFFWARGE